MLSMFAHSQGCTISKTPAKNTRWGSAVTEVCNGALSEKTEVLSCVAVPIQLVIPDGEIGVLAGLLLPCQQMKSK